jgi:hypothetical protein
MDMISVAQQSRGLVWPRGSWDAAAGFAQSVHRSVFKLTADSVHPGQQ